MTRRLIFSRDGTESEREMQHIGKYDDQLRRINDRRQAFRAQQIDRYRWDDDVSCVECGDTGWLPERSDKPCPSCDTGRAIAARQVREREWALACPRRFRAFTLDGHPKREPATAVRAWLNGDAALGSNLVITGSVGAGKTGLAIGVLREAFSRGESVKFGTVADILDRLRPSAMDDRERQDDMHSLQRVGVLLLDDLGVEKASEWQAERLYMIINDRHNRELPTVVTTNKTGRALIDTVGERVVSRLMEDAALVALTGEDLRDRGDVRVLA